jgi:hypothetical protein
MEARFAKITQSFDEALQARTRRFADWEAQCPMVKATLEEIALWLTLNGTYFKQVGVRVHASNPQLVTERQQVLMAHDIHRLTFEVGDFPLTQFQGQNGVVEEELQEHGFALQFNPTWNGKLYVVFTGYARDFAEEPTQQILKTIDEPATLDAAQVQALAEKALQLAMTTCHLFEGNANEAIHLARIGFNKNSSAPE